MLRDIRRPLVLASVSPRRRQILSMMGLEFETAPSGVADEESYINRNDLAGSLRGLAAAKAEPASWSNPKALALGADTIVIIDGEVLGKPRSRDDAARMLRALSGKRHTVVTAVALLCAEAGFCESAAAETDVYFNRFDDGDIEAYLSLPEYEDKAGSYAVQGRGACFIERIEGCYYNVMGLPVAAVIGLFNKFIGKDSIDVREE